MTATTFLPNAILWRALTEHAKAARHLDVAVAYFGRGGAKLLPLRKGHRLVIDMSVGTVRAGGTDPNEVERLMAAGVVAYSRRNLHAKMAIADKTLICSSANISRHSHDTLEEIGLLTTDPVAVREARELFESMCTEPIRPEYLAFCKQEYRPPQFPGTETGAATAEPISRPPSPRPKLWLVNLSEYELPEAEQKRFAEGLSVAEKRVKNKAAYTVESFYWLWQRLLGGQRLIMADYVRRTGATTGVHAVASAPWGGPVSENGGLCRGDGDQRRATGAGEPFMLPSLPYVMGNSLNLSPLAILGSLTIWAELWGIAGAFLAIPITTIVTIVLSEFSATRPFAILLSRDGRP